MSNLAFQAVLLVFFVCKIIQDAAYYVWVLQVKEYRLDRLKAHWRDNAEFRNHLLLNAALIGFLVFLSWDFFELTQAVALLYLAGGATSALLNLKNHTLKHPRLTSKVKLILALLGGWLLVTTALTYYRPSLFCLQQMAMIVLSTPLILSIITALITPIANRQKKRILKKAREKMNRLPHLRTIGVTGSYGKTSTKEFLYVILSERYKVIKTEGNNNTLMGVAQTVLNKLNDEVDFFVCEMGAYKRGEIAELCALTKPVAGIITGVNEQHLDLFGSMLNTKLAKFELAESLPKEGFAVISRRALALEPAIEIAAEEVPYDRKDLQNPIVKPTMIQFSYGGESFTLQAMGEHYAENLLAAIMTAEKLGMSLEEISRAVAKIKMHNPHLMRKITGHGGAIFLDDSYSANPTGVLAALKYMQAAYPHHQKILVFPGMIELGKDSEKIHEPVWKKVDAVCDIAFIMQDPKTGDHQHREHCLFIFERNFAKIEAGLRSRLNADTVVLFESRAAGVVMNRLLNEK